MLLTLRFGPQSHDGDEFGLEMAISMEGEASLHGYDC
jgi:hypothetical protein